MANKNDFGVDCPACDDPQALPILPSNDCPVAPKLSEIHTIYFSGDDKPTDWTTPAGWAGVIDNTDTTGAKTKALCGRGSKSEPEETVIEGAKKQDFVIDEESTIEFEVLNPSDPEVFAFLKRLKCGWTGDIWFETLGCCLVGGANGIPITSTKVSFPYESGRESYKKAFVRMTYSCPNYEPEPITSPLA